MTRTTTLAAQIKAAGFPVQSVEEATPGLDAEIVVTDAVSVQVGRSYFIVSHTTGEGDDWSMYSYPTRKTAAQVLEDVAAAIARPTA